MFRAGEHYASGEIVRPCPFSRSIRSVFEFYHPSLQFGCTNVRTAAFTALGKSDHRSMIA